MQPAFIHDAVRTPRGKGRKRGAIALGHAMGTTGTSLGGAVLDKLERRGLNIGLVAVPGAADIGTATIIERA